MTIWLLEPLAPMIARDGRPFGADPGAAATSLPMPYPGMVAGAWRSRAGQDAEGFFSLSPEAARAIAVSGPLLAAIDDAGGFTLAAPAPADALLLGTGPDDARRRRLAPIDPGDALVPMPDGLLPVGLVGDADAGKPW